MKQQTAVEWLVSHLNKQGFAQVVTDEEIEQAQKKHKGDLMRAFLINDDSISIQDALEKFEDYYNKTFKSE